MVLASEAPGIIFKDCTRLQSTVFNGQLAAHGCHRFDALHSCKARGCLFNWALEPAGAGGFPCSYLNVEMGSGCVSLGCCGSPPTSHLSSQAPSPTAPRQKDPKDADGPGSMVLH